MRTRRKQLLTNWRWWLLLIPHLMLLLVMLLPYLIFKPISLLAGFIHKHSEKLSRSIMDMKTPKFLNKIGDWIESNEKGEQ